MNFILNNIFLVFSLSTFSLFASTKKLSNAPRVCEKTTEKKLPNPRRVCKKTTNSCKENKSPNSKNAKIFYKIMYQSTENTLKLIQGKNLDDKKSLNAAIQESYDNADLTKNNLKKLSKLSQNPIIEKENIREKENFLKFIYMEKLNSFNDLITLFRENNNSNAVNSNTLINFIFEEWKKIILLQNKFFPKKIKSNLIIVPDLSQEIKSIKSINSMIQNHNLQTINQLSSFGTKYLCLWALKNLKELNEEDTGYIGSLLNNEKNDLPMETMKKDNFPPNDFLESPEIFFNSKL